MIGIDLAALPGALRKVPAHKAHKPVETIKDTDGKLGAHRRAILEDYFDQFDFMRDCYKLNLPALAGFSFDELCKLKYSTIFCMHKSVVDLFEASPPHELVRKIQNSMWRWSYSRGTWNEVVDAYEHIRSFAFSGGADFQIRLDHTTYHNQFGYSKYARIFVDGVFAFLAYYRGEHVMTIGFSLLSGKRLLIQQVQSAKARGNRYLFRLPRNRVEFVIGLFAQNFPGYRLFMVDGGMLAEKTLRDYREGLRSARESAKRERGFAEKARDDEAKSSCERYAKRKEEDALILADKIAHLEHDRSRLAAFYRETGRFALSPKTEVVFGLAHYQVAA